MIELLCGCVIGGSLSFMFTVMVMSARIPRVIARNGQHVEYTNAKGLTSMYELVNDLRDNDEFAILRTPNTQLEFVARVIGIEVI
jgi:hypothetical protein